jgi:AraC-like DNA-binding protein
MPESKYILFFIGALGAFNGLMLGIYFLFFAKQRNLSSFFLGCLLLALSLRIGKSVFVYFDPELPKFYLQIGLSGCFLIGPALLFFLRAAIEQPATLPLAWKRHIIGLLSVILIAGVLYPYATYPKLWNLYFVKVIYAVWLIYVVASGFQLKDIFSRLVNKRANIKTPEKWLVAIFATNALIFASFQMAPLFGRFYYYGGAVILSFVLYLMIFIHLYQGKTAEQFYIIASKYANKRLNDTDAAVVLKALEQALTELGLYKNADLTLAELARTINIPAHQLSQVLNDNLGKNFTSYVNGYRIHEARRMIAEGHPFTLEAIGYEVGFNSKSTFYAAFKKIKATTPLMYKEEITKHQQKAKLALSADQAFLSTDL